LGEVGIVPVKFRGHSIIRAWGEISAVA
jgi:hypothetical protein